jgi:PKD repeat protein
VKIVKIKNKLINLSTFTLILLFLGIGVSTSFAKPITAVILDMGAINIHGPPGDAYVVCSPVNNYGVKISSKGETVTIRVSYNMDCSVMADDGYCDINFVDGGGADSRHTSGSDSGYLTMSKFMMPGDSFTVKLHALYTDWYGVDQIGEDIQYAYGNVIGISQPNAQFSYSPSAPTKDNTIQFTDSSYAMESVITSWNWDFGDGTSSTIRAPSHKYQNDGNFQVRLTITDDYGQTSSITRALFIQKNNVPGFEFIIILISLSFILFWKRKLKK